MDVDLQKCSSTLLPVFASYRFEKINGREYIAGSLEKKPTFYNPLELDLIKVMSEFASIESNYIKKAGEIQEYKFNKTALLEFCNKYGLPGQINIIGAEELYKKNLLVYQRYSLWDYTGEGNVEKCLQMFEEIFPEGAPRRYGEGQFEKTYTKEFHQATFAESTLHLGIMRDDISSVLSSIKRFELFDTDTENGQSIYKKPEDTEEKRELALKISHHINTLMEGVEFNLLARNIDKNGDIRFIDEYYFEQLFQAWGITLREYISKGYKMGFCKNCNLDFTKRRENNEYCSPECGNAFRVREYRERRKKGINK